MRGFEYNSENDVNSQINSENATLSYPFQEIFLSKGEVKTKECKWRAKVFEWRAKVCNFYHVGFERFNEP